MGFGAREFESPRAPLQTQLRSEDGRSSRKEEGQNRRAKYSPTHFGFKLATDDAQTARQAALSWLVAFDLPGDHAAFFPPMRVFVVGGAGYIGSVCSELLLNEGHEVAIFDNLS